MALTRVESNIKDLPLKTLLGVNNNVLKVCILK